MESSSCRCLWSEREQLWPQAQVHCDRTQRLPLQREGYCQSHVFSVLVYFMCMCRHYVLVACVVVCIEIFILNNAHHLFTLLSDDRTEGSLCVSKRVFALCKHCTIVLMCTGLHVCMCTCLHIDTPFVFL